MNSKRVIAVTLGSLMLAVPVYLSAQESQEGQQSVADAARKAQAEKKDSPKAKLTIDNDNLSSLKGPVNVVGGEAEPPEDQTKAAEPKAGEKPKGEAYWRGKFEAARKKLDADSHELDITQRELNLKQEQFYQDPMASLKQDYSRQDINDTHTKIDELTAKVEQDKAAISDLEDQLRQAGGDPGWANPPSGAGPAESSQNSAPENSQPAPAPAPSQPATPPAATAPAPAGQTIAPPAQ